MGPASAVRHIDPADYIAQQRVGTRPAALPLRNERFRSRLTRSQILRNQRLLRRRQRESNSKGA
jgi:hypothetical protein